MYYLINLLNHIKRQKKDVDGFNGLSAVNLFGGTLSFNSSKVLAKTRTLV